MIEKPKPRRSIRLVVAKKIAANECLLCTSPMHKRGLCVKHYNRYRWVRSSKPENERELYDVDQIKKGKLIGSRQGQRTDIINEFRSAS